MPQMLQVHSCILGSMSRSQLWKSLKTAKILHYSHHFCGLSWMLDGLNVDSQRCQCWRKRPEKWRNKAGGVKDSRAKRRQLCINIFRSHHSDLEQWKQPFKCNEYEDISPGLQSVAKRLCASLTITNWLPIWEVVWWLFIAALWVI